MTNFIKACKSEYENEYAVVQAELNQIYKSKKEPYNLIYLEEKNVILRGKVLACQEMLEKLEENSKKLVNPEVSAEDCEFAHDFYLASIERTFKRVLASMDMTQTCEVRRQAFTIAFANAHRKLFQKYSFDIDNDTVDWSSYDGNVYVTYRVNKTITYENRKFYCGEILTSLC